MKKLIVAAVFATGLAACVSHKPATTSTVSTSFEGVITYSISIDNPQLAAMMQGATGKVYIKGDQIKTVMDMVMQKITIFDNRKTPDKQITLFEMMDNKYQIKDDSAKNNDKAPDIKYSDETKTLAGYVCHRADVTSTDKSGQTVTTTVYYTEEIPSFSGPKDPFKGLKGFPMEYSLKQPQATITCSATKVDKQSVSDDTFTVPTGYKLMTMAEIMQDIQKNMSNGN